MITVPQSGQQSAQVNDLAEKEAEAVRSRRGLRTLAHDIAEAKRNKQKNGVPVPMAVPKKPQMDKRAGAIVPPAPPQTKITARDTHYREELEKLAAKYIPEKKELVTSPQMSTAVPTKDALKSFEMNKAFNDQLHKNAAPKETERKEEKSAPVIAEPPSLQSKPAESIIVPEEKTLIEKEPEKKLTDLTEEDITRELEEVLHIRKEKDEGREKIEQKEGLERAPAEKESPRKERPMTSIKQLEETLYSVDQRIQSSTSRIETYREEEVAANTSLKNLFERRDLINKNLDPIKEKERAVLSAIRNHEEKEASATNKIERRDAENRRWERESERRELEDERWKLEEIFEKLRLVIEKTEYELVTVRKKLSEEESHKTELEAEKTITETHRALLLKREEQERATRKRDDIESEITNLKNELRVIRLNEETLEKEKETLESKIGALNDLGARRSLEKERRTIEDNLHDIEEKRWAQEDELKKHYAEKDERDREINLLTAELESLENKFDTLESAKPSPSPSE